MNFVEFSNLLSDTASPVVLLEGTRALPPEQAPRLRVLAAHLARTFPRARFRTGNAEGSDEAFAVGVASVDPSRLEFVLPKATHRSAQRPAESVSIAIDAISAENLQVVMDATVKATPYHQRLANNYREKRAHGRQLGSAQLILRDTLKVTGCDTLPPPVAGLFFVNAADPERGGTGHTMRVCRTRGVPVINQFEWLEWACE